MVLGGYISRRLGVRTRRHGGVKRHRSKQASLTAKVKKIVDAQTEKKFIAVGNTQLSASVANATPLMSLLNPLSQGITDNTRLGDRTRAKRLKLSLYFGAPVSATGVATTYVTCIFWYKNPRGTAPTTLMMFNSATPSSTDQFNDINVDFNSRFDIIAYRKHVLNYPAGTVGQAFVQDYDIDLQDHLVDYSINQLGSIADIDKGALYVHIHSDTTLVTQVFYAYYYYYMDM